MTDAHPGPPRPSPRPGNGGSLESGGDPRTPRVAGAVAMALVTALAACVPTSGPPTSRPPASPADDDLVPPGYGSLRQEEITLTLRSGSVQLKITPLEEWVLRLTAPDTYARLSGLAGSQTPAAEQRTGVASPTLLLVSFFSDDQGASFDPEDVRLDSRGRRARPLSILPLTAEWGTQRLVQRQAQMAVYAFDPELDLDVEDLVVEYRGIRNTEWASVLRLLQAERARARARAGGPRRGTKPPVGGKEPPPYSQSPMSNFLSFR